MSEHDSAFMRTFITILLSLVVFMIVIIVAARIIVGDKTSKVEPAAQAKIEKQIEPVGKVALAGSESAAATAAPAGKADGQAVYQQSCAACHSTGAAGAPKLGDKAGWKSRIAQGAKTLNDHAIKGFKGMPAKGGNTSLSDDAVIAAVDYMVAQSK